MARRPGWRAPVTTRFSLSRPPAVSVLSKKYFFFPLTFGVGRHGSRLYDTRCLSAHPPPPMSKGKWRFSILRIVTGWRVGGDGVAPKTKARKKIRRKKKTKKKHVFELYKQPFCIYVYCVCAMRYNICRPQSHGPGPSPTSLQCSSDPNIIIIIIIVYESLQRRRLYRVKSHNIHFQCTVVHVNVYNTYSATSMRPAGRSPTIRRNKYCRPGDVVRCELTCRTEAYLWEGRGGFSSHEISEKCLSRALWYEHISTYSGNSDARRTSIRRWRITFG